MFVNVDTSTVLSARTFAILDTLGLPNTDASLQRRVATFISCNGYESVYRAALFASQQVTKEKIEDIWAYTIQVYNGNIARLGHLYILTHLVENGLRSQVDLHLTVAHGDDWYRHPKVYLASHLLPSFWSDLRMLRLKAEDENVPVDERRVSDVGKPSRFLEQISFGWLNRIVLCGYGGPLRKVLVGESNQPIAYNEAESILRRVKEARNDVAHNRFINNGKYKQASQKLLRLAFLLRFDTDKALRRIEAVRSALVADLMQSR